jgi:hypothetical protein
MGAWPTNGLYDESYTACLLVTTIRLHPFLLAATGAQAEKVATSSGDPAQRRRTGRDVWGWVGGPA